jgi:hypothetical protein
VKVLAPSIAWFGRLVSPMHAKVTTHVLLGAKRHKLPRWKQWRWRATKVASKRRGLNIKKWLQPRKFAPLRSRFSGYSRYADLEPLRGKANVAGEETGKCNLQTVVVRAQASSEGLAEITSGVPVAAGAGSNLRRLHERGQGRSRERHLGLAHESVGAMTEE